MLSRSHIHVNNRSAASCLRRVAREGSVECTIGVATGDSLNTSAPLTPLPLVALLTTFAGVYVGVGGHRVDVRPSKCANEQTITHILYLLGTIMRAIFSTPHTHTHAHTLSMVARFARCSSDVTHPPALVSWLAGSVLLWTRRRLVLVQQVRVCVCVPRHEQWHLSENQHHLIE